MVWDRTQIQEVNFVMMTDSGCTKTGRRSLWSRPPTSCGTQLPQGSPWLGGEKSRVPRGFLEDTRSLSPEGSRQRGPEPLTPAPQVLSPSCLCSGFLLASPPQPAGRMLEELRHLGQGRRPVNLYQLTKQP